VPGPQELPPPGRYLAHEVGWLAGVSGNLIGQWARNGYIQSSHSARNPRVYSYQDVAEAMMVHELLDRNVELTAIKAAIKSLRDEYGDWPLQTAPILVPRKDPKRDGPSTQAVVVDKDEGYDVGRGAWQTIIKVDDLERVRSQLNRGGWAVRNLPHLEHIEVDPERLSGRPTIRGRRLAVEEVADLATTAEGMVVLVKDFRLSEKEILDANAWWKAVGEFELFAA
jgi:uncharacterized protein (DUF433 family)/DNA-binding transcriptional MerR regulator